MGSFLVFKLLIIYCVEAVFKTCNISLIILARKCISTKKDLKPKHYTCNVRKKKVLLFMYIILDLFVFMFFWCFTVHLNHRTAKRLFTLFSLYKTIFLCHNNNFAITILINIPVFPSSLGNLSVSQAEVSQNIKPSTGLHRYIFPRHMLHSFSRKILMVLFTHETHF